MYKKLYELIIKCERISFSFNNLGSIIIDDKIKSSQKFIDGVYILSSLMVDRDGVNISIAEFIFDILIDNIEPKSKDDYLVELMLAKYILPVDQSNVFLPIESHVDDSKIRQVFSKSFDDIINDFANEGSSLINSDQIVRLNKSFDYNTLIELIDSLINIAIAFEDFIKERIDRVTQIVTPKEDSCLESVFMTYGIFCNPDFNKYPIVNCGSQVEIESLLEFKVPDEKDFDNLSIGAMYPSYEPRRNIKICEVLDSSKFKGYYGKIVYLANLTYNI